MQSAFALVFTVLCLAGCKDRGGPKPVAPTAKGLSLIPKQAKQLAVGNVAKLAASPLVRHAVKELLSRDPELAERVNHLTTECGLAPEKIETVVIAIDAQDSLLVAHGALEEAALVACVSKRLPKSGSRLATLDINGQPAFQVVDSDGKPGLAFSFVDPKTVVVASGARWLKSALTKGDSIQSEPEFQRLFGQVKGDAALWMAGIVPEEVGRGLVDAAGGRLSRPPRTMWGHLDVDTGLTAHMAIDMSTSDEAKSLVSLANSQLQGFSMLAQRYKLGALLQKLELSAAGTVLHANISLSSEEVASLAQRIDTPAPAGQDAGPSAGKETDAAQVEVEHKVEGDAQILQGDAAPGR